MGSTHYRMIIVITLVSQTDKVESLTACRKECEREWSCHCPCGAVPAMAAAWPGWTTNPTALVQTTRIPILTPVSATLNSVPLAPPFNVIVLPC